MPWYSVLHVWKFHGQREIHRHDIDDLPTIGHAIVSELQLMGQNHYNSRDVLAIVPTDEADEIAKVFSRKLGLRYTVGHGIYPNETEESKKGV